MPTRTLVIASGNAGKLREFAELLSDLPLEVQPQPAGMEVEETGSTFADNARIKARAVATATGHWALADDSGLSVEALNGAPGVYSARYADSDQARIDRLLRELGESRNRKAHFCAALCIASPDGTVLVEVEGRCDGLITTAARGNQGFGYDPIFEVIGTGQTFAEMNAPAKQVHGHRGRAFKLLEPRLRQLLESVG
ncbi:MAG: RdgB/HAM1 family non-canonical purine NTP pyrophosphatase [Synechococcus sp.]|nr:RdgB/HAM1 family non-canonical purine NTP pyrophosphatase [Synechococcus sp.]